jgi:transposase-like protein
MPTEPRSPAKRRGRYPKECRRHSAALIIDKKRTVADVARSFGLNGQTLGNWVRQERVDRGEREGLTSGERSELTRLRREVLQLRQERELLKKATALFV